MSTQPPNPPPGQPAYGPTQGQDPRDWARQQKEYWRAQKEQNKAYWRANREQWKSQREQYRAYYGGYQRRSLFGPVVLILIGALALLIYSGRVDAYRFWEWYGHWWPALLIIAGVALIIEWAVDRENPYGRRHSGLGGIIVLLFITGLIASGTNHWNWSGLDDDMGGDDSMRSFFHGEEHDSDSTATSALAAGNSVRIVSGVHGDIAVQSGEDNGQLIVLVHKRIFGGSDSDGRKRADDFNPVITTSGTVTTITLNGKDRDEANLDITLPAGVPVEISGTRGDLSVSGRHAAVNYSGHHGDMHVRDITGPVTLHSDGGTVSVDEVRGDVSLSGNVGDTTIADIQGGVVINGDVDGDLSLHAITSQVHYHSSRTDLLLRRLDGQLNIDGEDLHISQAVGPLKLTTRGKQIELANVAGDINVSNSDGSVEVTPALPLGNITVDNRNEAIRLTMPGNAGFQLRAQANGGEVENDFGLQTYSSGEENHSVTGRVGDGSVTVNLNTQHGDIAVHRADSAMTMPPAPPVPPAPAAPGAVSGPAAMPAPKLSRVPRAPKAPSAPPAPAVENQ